MQARLRLQSKMWTWLATVIVLSLNSRSWSQDRFLCAAHGQHLWFITAAQKPMTGFALCHHATDLGGPYYKVQATIAQRPAGLACWGNRVWVVFAPNSGIALPQREVFTIQVQKNEAWGVYMSVPAGRMDLAPSLTGDGELGRFVGAPDGPIALVSAAPNSRATSIATTAPAAAHRLLQLRDNGWVEMDLPEDLGERSPSAVVAGGRDGSRLSLLGTTLNGARQGVLFDRDDHGPWRRVVVSDASIVESLIAVNGQVVAVANRDDGTLACMYLRSGTLVPLIEIPRPATSWSAVGLGERLCIVENNPSNQLALQHFQPVTGEHLSTQVLVHQSVAAGKLWQLALLTGLTISALLLVMLVKPSSKSALMLPSEVELLPPLPRLLALCFDLVPAAVATTLLLRCRPSDLFLIPVLSSLDLERSVPWIVMAALTTLHSSVSEMAKATTLGKALVGAHVTTLTGERPTTINLLLRNILKGIVLLIPPLAIIGVLNPNRQGIGDMVARTVVVRRAEHEGQEQSSDQ